MAPVSRKTLNNSSKENDFNYFTFASSSLKRRQSFRDTLKRTKLKVMSEWNHDVSVCKEEPVVWQTFNSNYPRKEFDLEQKIDLEIKMHEGTTKLLAACRHPFQSLEAAKTLLTSRERMTTYLAELQRRKADTISTKATSDQYSSMKPCLAKVSVSDIRMPLIWKDTDHFKNKGDYRRFAVFCLLRIGTEIYDTAMINKVDRSMTDISFEDTILFNQVPHDFEFRLEVYSHILQDDMSIASTPLKIKRHINDSLSRKVGRKLAASMKDELTAVEIGPKFELVAQATLRLEDVDNNICTHDLHIENSENTLNQLPLFGHFCCRLAALPEFLSSEAMCGQLRVQTDITNHTDQLWGILKSNQLELWNSLSSNHIPGNPEFTIPINKETVIDLKENDGGTEHHISISNSHDIGGEEYRLSGIETETTDRWCCALRSIVLNHIAWKHAASTVMVIQTPGADRLTLILRSRKGSLYEQTPLKDSPKATAVLGSSPLLRRSRSSSLSSSASSSGSSAQPFLPSVRRTRASQRFSCHETCV